MKWHGTRQTIQANDEWQSNIVHDVFGIGNFYTWLGHISAFKVDDK